MDKQSSNFKKLGDIINKQKPIKPPAYQWQELALKIIKELNVPLFKKSAVFKLAKELPQIRLEQFLNDTKELAHEGAKWKYFFKVADNYLKNEIGH